MLCIFEKSLKGPLQPLRAPLGASLIISSLGAAIVDKQVTYDFARLMEGANEVSCSAFGRAMIERM